MTNALRMLLVMHRLGLNMPRWQRPLILWALMGEPLPPSVFRRGRQRYVR